FESLLSLYLMTARQRSYTLFPYTTLFRSGGGHGHALDGEAAPDVSHAEQLDRSIRPAHQPRPEQGVRRHLDARHPVRGGAGAPADRKSTRLNSSHVAISYAVFCLKKKTSP